MRNKLKLAIICTVLQFILSLVMNNIPYFYEDGGWFIRAGADILFFIKLLCSLGTLPFFVALYKSKDFTALVDKENTMTLDNRKDSEWLKHLIIRVGLLVVLSLPLILISIFDNSLGGAYILAYGIAILLGVSVLFFSIEAIILYRKKLYFKFWSNILIAGIFIWIFLKLL